MDIKNSVIAITGAGQGLGQMMAITLAQSGADLALLDVNETGLRETQSQCQMLSAKAFTYPVDVTNESDVEATFDAILQDFGQLNGLINNAGVLRDGLLVKAKDGVINKMSLEQFNLVMNVNVTGTFLCGREAAVKMIESGSQGSSSISPALREPGILVKPTIPLLKRRSLPWQQRGHASLQGTAFEPLRLRQGLYIRRWLIK